MKKIIYLAVFAVFAGLTGCNHFRKEDLKVTVYKDTAVVIPSPETKNVPAGAELGKIKAYKAKNKLEQNMLSQYADFQSACLLGSYGAVSKYLYPDAISYYRKDFPNMSEDEIKAEFARQMSQASSAVDQLASQGFKYESVVPYITKKVQYGKDLFLVYDVVTNIYNETFYTHVSEYQSAFAHSSDGGKNWTFWVENGETANVLSLSFPDEVANEVASYAVYDSRTNK